MSSSWLIPRSYYLGREGESDLLARLDKSTGKRVITAFGSVLRALERLNVRRLAPGAPYSRETTLQGKAHLEAHGLEVVNFAHLPAAPTRKPAPQSRRRCS